MAYKRFLLGSLIAVCLACIYGFMGLAGDPLAKIRQQLEKWAYENPVEKVYVQMDKPYYGAGDDIWFKVYVVSGNDHQLSTVSSIVNVELIDQRDSILQSVKLPLSLGTANGDFALPDTLHSGGYRIRAYTNYMRNAGSDYFYSKAVSIINPLATGKDSIPKMPVLNKGAGKTDVQFFPEGGYLVNGIATKVAFKAVGVNGLGTAIKGTITDSKGKLVTRFNSMHLGMGVFDITPAAGEVYQANVSYADGTENTIALPKAIDKGYVLNITDSDPQDLRIKVTASKLLYNEDRESQFTLVAQSAGKIYYTAKSKPGSAIFTSVVPKNTFPSGIVQFTLFSSAGEPLNERLVFIQNPDLLNLTVTADAETYAPRQKVKIAVDAKNRDNKPVAGNFSVSVIDETRVPVDEDTGNNIFASLLLTADLGGYVERPAWYFNNPDDQTRAALDVLMLTQGYRRFEWKRILNNDFPVMQYKPENSLKISGTVLTPAGKPVPNAKVNLYDLDSIQFTRDTVTDDRGRFVFKNLTFNDSIRLIVQARTAKNKKDVDIKMDKEGPPGIPGDKVVPDFSITSNNLSVYARSNKQLYELERKFGLGNHVISLQEVVIREKKQALKYSANLNGPGNADQIIRSRDLYESGCVNIPDCLQGRLLGVVFRNGIPYSTRGYGRMQVIVDGAYVDGSYLRDLNYTDIQAIEVLRNVEYTAIYGSRGANGVLLVTTRHGGDNDDYPQPIYGRGITTYYPKGYYKARVFYSPQYDQPKTNKQLADLRTTVFWEPNLLTGKDGKTSFEFYNAGSKGVYRVVIEGIDGYGNIGRQVYRYKVQ